MSAQRPRGWWLVLAALPLAACASAPTTLASPAAQPRVLLVSPAPSHSGTGAYLDFATCDPVTCLKQADTTHVYFFYADDCAECRDTDAALRADGVPDGVTVFKVMLPSMSVMAERYGVTRPHTFVQIDKERVKVRAWTGSRDGAEIAARTSA